MKTIVLSAALILGSALGVSAAVTATPLVSSAFVEGSMTDTNAAVTNAFKLNAATSTAPLVTNLPAAVGKVLEVSGADSVQVWVRSVQSHAGGTTNNGFTHLVFASSPDGVVWTTGSNAFNVAFPSTGTSAGGWQTNIAAQWFGSPGYVKLLTVAHTNIGPTYLSNVVLRTIQVK